MITIHIYILLALALAGAFVAHRSRLPALYILVAVALLAAAGGVYTTGIFPAPGDLCLVNTTEDSLYWNCTADYDYSNASCDSINVTYNYDYCTAAGNTQPEALGTTWALIFALLTLILLAAGILMYLRGEYGATAEA